MRTSQNPACKKITCFFLALILYSTNSFAQKLHQENQQPELALGVRVISGQIQYGQNSRFVTDPTSISLLPAIRYDVPVKLGAYRHIDLMVQTGFLFCKARVFDTSYFDPNLNRYQYEYSENPAYFPVYFGVYNMAPLSVGTELFYWKGLGNRDIWGLKFFSIGYKARRFRISMAGELYGQVKNSRNGGLLLSFDFLWKLIKDYTPDR